MTYVQGEVPEVTAAATRAHSAQTNPNSDDSEGGAASTDVTAADASEQTRGRGLEGSSGSSSSPEVVSVCRCVTPECSSLG